MERAIDTVPTAQKDVVSNHNLPNESINLWF